MECERFKRLLKTWYLQVQNESLAPARMVDFMHQHVSDCPTCMMDPEAKTDIAKIITLVLPQDKLKPASRNKKTDEDDDEERDETTDEKTDDEVESDDFNDESEDKEDDEDDLDD